MRIPFSAASRFAIIQTGYLVSHHGEQIAEFVEVETSKRGDRPQLAAATALAKRRRATMLVAKLDRLSRSVAFIATLMDSRGVRSRHCLGL